MTKKDILDILYAERNRLLSVYTRPGWTTWALFAAIGSLIWILIVLVSLLVQNNKKQILFLRKEALTQ